MIILIVIFCCLIMGFVDAVVQPAYHIKSIIKMILFISIPALYNYKNKETFGFFKFEKKNLLKSFLLAIGVFVLILSAYLVGSKIFDFSAITTSLSNNIGVNSNNLIFVTTYIALVNSLLEEFFFRGFTFFSLRKIKSRKFSYIFSSLMFAFYHVAMMIGWFDLWLFMLILIGLFIGGLIFIYVNEKNENIYSSWLVHMFANFAINLIGFILFGIVSI